MFSAEPPFRLLAITPLPVLAPNFYTGNYAEKANRHLDYVVFPMSFFFEDELEAADGAPHAQTGARALRSNQTHARSRGQKHTTVILSFGAQDREGWLARVPLHALLDSMVNVPAADVSR